MDYLNLGITWGHIPFVDIVDQRDSVFDAVERIQRRKLTCLIRLLSYYHWDRPTHNHITLKLKDGHILCPSQSLMSWEITSYNLMTISIGEKEYEKSLGDDYKLDHIIYKFRPDINCVLHLQCPLAIAISILGSRILPLSKDALLLGTVSYYPHADEIDESEIRNFVNQLGPINKVVVLKNDGVLLLGKCIEEIFFLTNRLMYACSTQLNCLKYDPVFQLQLVRVPPSFGPSFNAQASSIQSIEFEAHIRLLEKFGFHTGHPWKINENYFNSQNKLSEIIAKPTQFLNSFPSPDYPNHDSGVATIAPLDEDGTYSRTIVNSLPGDMLDYIDDEQVPMSESSKELQIRDALLLNENNHLYIPNERNDPLSNYHIPRRQRNFTKSHALIRRSKSLTSGVERAIFRKQNEKIFSDRR